MPPPRISRPLVNSTFSTSSSSFTQATYFFSSFSNSLFRPYQNHPRCTEQTHSFSLRASPLPCFHHSTPVRGSFKTPSLTDHNPSLHAQHQQTRQAHHASEGRANRARRGAGKRLGAKKTASSPVVPGNIIFRQRGTLWHPGENCGIGRDHSIFAKEKGYVVYYRIPWKNVRGERKMIGVVFEQGQKLPRNPGEKRRRRLGMLGRAREIKDDDTETANATADQPDAEKPSLATVIPPSGKGNANAKNLSPMARSRIPPSELKLKPGYMYRESNASIGRSADRAGLSWRNTISRRKLMQYMRWKKMERGDQKKLLALAASTKKDKGKREGKKKNVKQKR